MGILKGIFVTENQRFSDEQLDRALKDSPKPPRVHNKYHNTAPADAIYIGRGSPYGNPYVIGKDGTREEVIARFEEHVLPTLNLDAIRGKDLVCFCSPKPCHGDLLLKYANKVK